MTSPFHRWQLIGDFLRLVLISCRVTNREAPVNCILVGPPGDGKTKMIMRGADLKFMTTLADMSYLGIVRLLPQVRDGYISGIIIPDLATLVGRKMEVGRQTIGMLARLCAEGVGPIAVGRQVKDFTGVRATLISAVTPEDLLDNWKVFNQNAFLSRTFLLDFDLTQREIEAMSHRKNTGDRKLLETFHFHKSQANRAWKVRCSPRYAGKAIGWWKELLTSGKPAYAFRTVDAFTDLLRASAFLHGRRTVIQQDVNYLTRFRSLWLNQFQKEKNQ